MKEKYKKFLQVSVALACLQIDVLAMEIDESSSVLEEKKRSRLALGEDSNPPSTPLKKSKMGDQVLSELNEDTLKRIPLERGIWCHHLNYECLGKCFSTREWHNDSAMAIQDFQYDYKENSKDYDPSSINFAKLRIESIFHKSKNNKQKWKREIYEIPKLFSSRKSEDDSTLSCSTFFPTQTDGVQFVNKFLKSPIKKIMILHILIIMQKLRFYNIYYKKVPGKKKIAVKKTGNKETGDKEIGTKKVGEANIKQKKVGPQK